jgi:hypothetical protein
VDLERDVLHRVEIVGIAEAKRVQDPLLEGVDLQPRNTERLADVLNDDRWRPLGVRDSGGRALLG